MTGRPTLAVVGATGAVGQVMLQILSQHADIWGEIRLISSPSPLPGSSSPSPSTRPFSSSSPALPHSLPHSLSPSLSSPFSSSPSLAASPAGAQPRKLTVRGEEVEVVPLTEEALDGVDVAVWDVPDEVAAQWAPVAASRGAVVVDHSAAFRMDPEVPLVVPEVNPHTVRMRPRGIVAGPGCTTLSMIVALGALHAEYGLRDLVVSSYQAVSGAGQDGVDTLRRQLSLVAGTELGTSPGDLRRALGDDTGPFPEPVALNVVPWTGEVCDDGWSSEEMRVRDECRKVLGQPALPVAVTCVRVPVVTAHAVNVHARFENEVTVGKAREILATAPGVVLFDNPEAGEFPTPADVVGTDPTWVGRLRRALDDPTALEFFVCGDNLRKGAALNTVQIAELVAAESR